jgi:hypothetical protein
MDRMPDLFADLPADEPVVVPAPADPAPDGRRPTIQERFEAFHRSNEWVYHALARMARELKAKGHTRIGIAMLFESLRWMHMRRTADPTGSFKLNNLLRSRYARALMENEPDLAGVFEVRELQTD